MTLTRLSYFDRPAYQLANDRLCLTIVPAFSGRVMELLVDGQNCLWTNVPLLKGEAEGDPTFGGWKNWGGYKTWLGPQSRWPDPDAQSDEMDNAEWEVVERSPTHLELLGPPIPWGGVRLGRRLSLATGEPRVRVLESIANTGDAVQSWAVWAVTQFPVPGCATYPPDGGRRVLVPPAAEFDGDRLRFVGGSKWKVGAFTRAGWGSYRADSWGCTFRANFAVHAGLPQPDDCTLETWSNSDPDYMELEWLGPMVTLQPGERWVFETDWEVV